MSKVTPFLMYNNQLEQAIEFYTKTFPDSKVHRIARSGSDGPVTSAEFTVGGQRFMAFNGGDHFQFSDAFSLFVDCEDQAEVDLYWSKILKAGGEEQQCGWIIDPFGVRWQVVPRRFMELMADEDPRKVQAVTEAMMKMVKLDVEGLEEAYAKA